MPVIRACLVHSIYHNPNDEDEDGDEEKEEDVYEEAQPRPQMACVTVTSESLVSREFSRFFLKFHLSISVSRYFNFTFTSRKE